MYGERMIIPKTMQPEVLERVHNGHLGINIWKSDDIVASERMLHLYWKVNSKERTNDPSTNSRKALARNWYWYLFRRKHFLVVCDYYSHYIEVVENENQATYCIITKLKSIFVRHGIPERVRTDNGPQFSPLSTSEFRRFAKVGDLNTPLLVHIFHKAMASPNLPSK